MTASILIVEDESIVALDLESRLNRLGYQVVGIAESGEDALSLAELRHPDLALMDIRLKSSMDGVETAQQLRARFDIPVIYLTAYADETTLERARVTEPFGYLVKPFEERELHSTIEMAHYKIEMDKRSKTQTARLQRIVSTVPEGVALLDSNFRIVLANAKAQDYLADLAEVSVGGMINRLGVHPIEHLLNITNSETWHEIEMMGASSRVFEAIFSPTSNAPQPVDKESSEWVLVIREVTAERQIQKRIQLQDRLAAVGQFAAGMAHDFNNLLTSVMLSAEILNMRETNLTPKGSERLETIQLQALRASELIKQVLDFSRASEMEMQVIDLLSPLKELVEMLERILPESIRLELSYVPIDYTVKGDATRILQMLMNLALNARDAMAEGGILRIELAHISSSDAPLNLLENHEDWIRCTVTDTGSGISPAVLPRVFEPFFTTKSPDKGTGLGLAQVYGIVQQHGGQIEVDSLLGKGTTFSIYLPALCSSSSIEAPLDNGETAPAQGNQQTILLVEDNLGVRDSISEVLEFSNYRVIVAPNGREALAILAQPETHVDLVLSDLIMPEMGGLEFCRELRRQHNPVKVIILTGYIDEETIKELRALAVLECINKPVEIEKLIRAVEGALQKPSNS